MTTIYVSPSENIQEAADDLKTGDPLVLRPGHHFGRIIVPVDGVTITGEPGAILEGTEALANTWELAEDSDGITSLAGTGTWRVPQAEQIWQLMEAGGASILRIDSDFVGVTDWNNYWGMSAYSALAVPNNSRPGPDYQADWWNGIEAMYVWNPHNQHLYVRYRDGRKPDKLRWSGGHWDHREPPYPDGSVIYIGGKRDVTVAELQIRGCVDGVAIVNSSNVQVTGCTFQGFDFATRVYGNCDRVAVTSCEFDSKLLGTEACAPISKISTENPYSDARLTAFHTYAMHKFWHDESDSTHVSAMSIYNAWDDGSQTVHRPRSVEFAYNRVRHSVFGVDMFGGDGINLHHNLVENMIDMAFQRSPDGGRNVEIHDNEVHEAGYCLMRWHAADQEAGDNYVYNNRVSDVDQVSDFVFLSRRSGSGDAHSQLRIWLYHNSYSGGNSICIMDGMLSMLGFNAVNNVVSNGGMTTVASGVPSAIGITDYNFVTGPAGRSAAALGVPIRRGKRGGELFTVKPTRNVAGTIAIWPSDEIERNFVLPLGHPAKGSGVDVSYPFVIDGVTYEPLPGFEPGYFQGAAPDMGWINRNEDGGETVSEAAKLTTPAPGSILPGASVTFAWNAVTDVNEYWLDIGPTPDTIGQFFSATAGLALSIEASNLPTNGTYVYAQLWTKFTSDQWESGGIETYTAASGTEPEPEPEPEPPKEEMILAFVPVWVYPEDVEPVKDPPQITPAFGLFRSMPALKKFRKKKPS